MLARVIKAVFVGVVVWVVCEIIAQAVFNAKSTIPELLGVLAAAYVFLTGNDIV